MRILTIREERWPIAGGFTIARGSKTEAHVILVEIAEGPFIGRGEAVPYVRYGESVAQSVSQMEGARAAIEGGCGREGLQSLLPPGAARNALDCALWDLDAKVAGVRVAPEPAR